MTHPFSYQDRRVVVTGRRARRRRRVARRARRARRRARHRARPQPAERAARHVPGHGPVRRSRRARRRSRGIDGPVHALFNNAGVADTPPPPTVLSVNYLALRTLSEGLLDRMPDGGAIVNTASLAGNLWRKRVQPINELLDIDITDGWAARAAVVRREPAGARPDAVQLHEGSRGGVHDAFVASDDAPRRAHEHRLPGPDRHAAAPRVPGDDQRQDRRLEHPRDERARGDPARSRRCSRSSARRPRRTSTA